MASAVPVVTSDIPPLREVAGDAALYVSNPLDVDEWRRALARICSDDALRADLSERGAERAARFAWPEVGHRFADLLHRVAATGGLTSSARQAAPLDAGAGLATTVPPLPAGVPGGAEPTE